MERIRISLNGACPCRSGEKYKKCCMGKISSEQEDYFGYLQYFDKIKNKLIRWFFLELKQEEQIYYAKKFGVKNVAVIKRQDNPARFFEWLFYEAKNKETNEHMLQIIIERFPYLFIADELLVLRERLNNNQAGVFEILSSDEKSWKIKLKELNTGKIYEVMDRLGSLDSAVGDIILSRIEKVFSRHYLSGFGLMVPRRSSNELLSYIKDKYEIMKKKNPLLEYIDFVNLNLTEIMKFKISPVKFISSDGEELKICEGRFKYNNEEFIRLIDYYDRNKDFEITELNYEKRTAHVLLKRGNIKFNKEENMQIMSLFAISPEGERIEYTSSIDIKEDKIKIFSQSEKSYQIIIDGINNTLNKKLILIREKLQSSEEILKRNLKESKVTEDKNDIDPYKKLQLTKDFLTDYYTKWCDERIPALNKKTPREAIQTEEGRRMLKDLLIDFKNFDEHKRKSGEINFSIEKLIRDELKFYD